MPRWPTEVISDFIPIGEAVARVVGRVMRRQREREDEAALVARHPVADPEDEVRRGAFQGARGVSHLPLAARAVAAAVVGVWLWAIWALAQ
jgi:hypothetical protein